MPTTPELYNDYKSTLQKIADIKYASAVLQWDQETYLPAKGNDHRSAQIATLSEIAHEYFTDEKFGNTLADLNAKADLSQTEKRNVELSLEDFNRNKKLSSAFVKKLSESISKAYHNWAAARKQNDFSIFRESLSQLIELKKQEADMLGYEQHPYNALMNDYDKGLTVAITDKIFAGLKPALINLLDTIQQKPQVNDSFLHLHYDKDTQWKFGVEILRNIGFDFEAGRQDLSLHPFTTSFSAQDVRLTTRVDENDLGNMTWSCIHEGGHGLYEQGLPDEQYGLPLGEFCSLSIHESQSRLWENCIGRGKPFWQHNFTLLQTLFPQQLQSIDVDDFYKGINKVAPSLIRTEADELTYHFHVMIRYEIEKMLIEGSITAADVPAYWNEHYKKYLGVDVPDDNKGCLQDIHWSHGSFGYFATYSLGSMYAAQLFAAIKKQQPGLDAAIAAGNNDAVLGWLKNNIYPHGRYYSSEALCEKATGEPLNPAYFIDYVTAKYTAIYQ